MPEPIDIDSVLGEFLKGQSSDIEKAVAEARVTLHKIADESCGPVLLAAVQSVHNIDKAHGAMPELKAVLGDSLSPIAVLHLMMESQGDAADKLHKTLHGKMPVDMMAIQDQVVQFCRFGPLTLALMNIVGDQILTEQSGD